jgi:hypothetical protein
MYYLFIKHYQCSHSNYQQKSSSQENTLMSKNETHQNNSLLELLSNLTPKIFLALLASMFKTNSKFLLQIIDHMLPNIVIPLPPPSYYHYTRINYWLL